MDGNQVDKYVSKTEDFLIYTSEDGESKLKIRLIDETIWLSQKQISELFRKEVHTINEHIKNIFAENELEDSLATVRKFRIVQDEGNRKNVVGGC